MKKNWKLFFGSLLILALAGVGVLAGVIAPFDPAENDLLIRLQSPGEIHLLGTDHLGRDVLSRLLHGARLSMGIAFLVLGISLVLGVLIGILIGYFGGIVDSVFMSVIDILLAFPNMILSLAVAGILGAGLRNTVIAMCLVSWIGYARMVRNIVMSLREKEFVKAARISGTPHGVIMIRHIFPNILVPVLVYAGTNIGSVLMQLAALSFLGLGAQPPTAEWGAMLNEAKGYMTAAPWLTIGPSVMLILTVTGFNLFGEGISVAFSKGKGER